MTILLVNLAQTVWAVRQVVDAVRGTEGQVPSTHFDAIRLDCRKTVLKMVFHELVQHATAET